jgi:uncharacterized protein YuzE
MMTDDHLQKVIEGMQRYAEWLRDHNTSDVANKLLEITDMKDSSDDDDDSGFYLTGRRNARNIYQRGVDHDSNIHIGVMFEPEMAQLVVAALNEYHEKRNRPSNYDVYVTIKDHASVDLTQSITNSVNFDYNEKREIVGVEVLGARDVTIDGRIVVPEE